MLNGSFSFLNLIHRVLNIIIIESLKQPKYIVCVPLSPGACHSLRWNNYLIYYNLKKSGGIQMNAFLIYRDQG